MQLLEQMGAGVEAIAPILQIMERHPLEDFGMPGSMVHFVERFFNKGDEEQLLESLRRRPTCHTVWMLNRIMNGSEEVQQYLELMEEIANNQNLEMEIRERAKEYLDFQNSKS